MRVGVALLLAIAVGSTAAADSAGSLAAQLRVVSRSPVAISGLHFAAGERVTVRLGAGGAGNTRVVRADGRGAFTVRFAVSSDPCTATLLVTARGATGDRATVKSIARACPPAP